ncbi:hypothetical protein DH2020_001961 [Rehmannia glutinosa]|uniref:Uncharacterized protein n=1 Tax=Rehmannia glutinosa TaxID=99300 RepID=A0ABR0XSV6_REHGL
MPGGRTHAHTTKKDKYPRKQRKWVRMADLPRYMRACLQSGKLAMLAMLVSGGIVLQILVRSMLWIDATKFLTGASAVGSIAIPVILKHAGVIGWGALAMELSSYFIFVMAILCYLGTHEDDGYSMF